MGVFLKIIWGNFAMISKIKQKEFNGIRFKIRTFILLHINDAHCNICIFVKPTFLLLCKLRSNIYHARDT